MFRITLLFILSVVTFSWALRANAPLQFSTNTSTFLAHPNPNRLLSDMPSPPSRFIVVKRTTRHYEDPVFTLEKFIHVVERQHYLPFPGDELAEWLPEHKRANTTTEFPVVVRCLDDSCQQSFAQGNYTHLFNHRWRVFDGNLTEIENDDDVLWIEPSRSLRMHSYDSMKVSFTPILPNNTAGFGEGVIIAITDTGLDYYHKTFYDSANPIPTKGSIYPSNHSKVASYMTSTPGTTDYFCGIDGCHGTATAGTAAGFSIGPNRLGMAPAARLAYWDMSPAGSDSLYLTDTSLYQYLMDVCDPNKGQAIIVSMSWGSDDTTGQYDIYSDVVDEVALARPGCSITIACGNGGPYGLCSSPSNSFNSDSIGASFSQPDAYTSLWYDASIHPDRYQWNVVAGFSSTGPLPGGRRAPLFYAPGVAEFAPYGYTTAHSYPNHADYAAYFGTSFSCPNVAGLKAEFQRRHRVVYGAFTTHDVVRSFLITRSEPMSGQVMTVYSNVGAVPLASHPAVGGYGFPKLPTDGLDGIPMTGTITNTDGRRAYCFVANRTGEGVQIGGSWPDINSPTLVNDLDFRVFLNSSSSIYADAVNSHDSMTVSPGSNGRVVVYEKDGVIQGGTITFGLFFRNTLQVTECGTCLADEQQNCTSQSMRLCNITTGGFTSTCYYKTQPFNTTLNGNTCSNPSNCTCAGDLYWLPNSGCGCLPGTEAFCTTGQVKQCQASGTGFGSCYYKSTGLLQQAQVRVLNSAVRSNVGTSVILMIVIAIGFSLG